MRGLGVLLVLLGLGVTACSGADPDEPDSSSTPSSTAPSSEATASATDTPAALLQPCDLLGPDDWNRYVKPVYKKIVYESTGLDIQTGTYKSCNLMAGRQTLATWGYSTDPDVWRQVEKETSPRSIEGGDTGAEDAAESVVEVRRAEVPVGDEGFVVAAFASIDGHFRVDETAFKFSPSAGFGMVPGPVTGVDINTAIEAMAAAAVDGVDPSPISLPESCPAADSAEVTDLIGEVAYAYGGELPGLTPTCAYRSTAGTLLETAGSVNPKGTIERELDFEFSGKSEVLEDTPTTQVTLIGEPDKGFKLFLLYPKSNYSMAVLTEPTTWGPQRVDGDRAAFLRFAQAYRTVAEPMIG